MSKFGKQVVVNEDEGGMDDFGNYEREIAKDSEIQMTDKFDFNTMGNGGRKPSFKKQDSDLSDDSPPVKYGQVELNDNDSDSEDENPQTTAMSKFHKNPKISNMSITSGQRTHLPELKEEENEDEEDDYQNTAVKLFQTQDNNKRSKTQDPFKNAFEQKAEPEANFGFDSFQTAPTQQVRFSATQNPNKPQNNASVDENSRNEKSENEEGISLGFEAYDVKKEMVKRGVHYPQQQILESE